MPEDALILRVSVDEDQHLSASGTKSADVYTARTACTDAVTQHAPAGDNNSWHFLHDGWKHACPLVCQESFATEGVDRHWKMTDIRGRTTSRDDHFAHLSGVLDALALCFSLQRKPTKAGDE